MHVQAKNSNPYETTHSTTRNLSFQIVVLRVDGQTFENDILTEDGFMSLTQILGISQALIVSSGVYRKFFPEKDKIFYRKAKFGLLFGK
jgi:hypothetical protein